MVTYTFLNNNIIDYYSYYEYHDYINPENKTILACSIYYLLLLLDLYTYELDLVLLHLTTMKSCVIDTSESRCRYYTYD